MKNFLISLLTICCSFLITLFILNQFNTKSATKIVANQTQEVLEEEFEEEASDENVSSLNIEKNDFEAERTNNEDLDDKPLENESYSEEKVTNSASLDFSDTHADYDTWKAYYKENIDLATDFIAVDTDNNEISKTVFLEKLKTGNYAPIKLFDAEYMYQLYKLDDTSDQKISKSIKSSSSTIYSYYSKEGKAFPEFNFKDTAGNSYTSFNTKGNILVIECWFVQCTACIQEFPKVNALYDKYEAHDNIIFLSLAFDKAEKIKKFLSKKEYRYPVIPDQKDFIKNKLEVIQYPTHLIIDKYGDIKKMVNNVDSLILALDTMVNGKLIIDDM